MVPQNAVIGSSILPLAFSVSTNRKNGNNFYNQLSIPIMFLPFQVLLTSPLSFLIFGCDAPSPKTISLDLPVKLLPPDYYAKHMLSGMQIAHHRFTIIKSDLCHHQKEVYDCKARFLAIPQVKLFIFARSLTQTSKTGEPTRFLRTFDGPFIVTSHPYDCNDLLMLKHLSTGAALPRPVNIEKCVVVPDQDTLIFSLQVMLLLFLNLRKRFQHLLLMFLMSTHNSLRLPMSLASICLHCLTKLPQPLRHPNRFT